MSASLDEHITDKFARIPSYTTSVLNQSSHLLSIYSYLSLKHLMSGCHTSSLVSVHDTPISLIVNVPMYIELSSPGLYKYHERSIIGKRR